MAVHCPTGVLLRLYSERLPKSERIVMQPIHSQIGIHHIMHHPSSTIPSSTIAPFPVSHQKLLTFQINNFCFAFGDTDFFARFPPSAIWLALLDFHLRRYSSLRSISAFGDAACLKNLIVVPGRSTPKKRFAICFYYFFNP